MNKTSIVELIKKYDKPGPRYTSYPPATCFNNSFGNTDYIQSVQLSNQQQPANISFYFHIPFCPQLCHFCGCNTEIMRNKKYIDAYINALLTELEFVSGYIDKSRPVSQVHWGGGTPNSIPIKYIARIMEFLSANFKFAQNCEIAMECNPAYVTFQQVDELAAMGFNRISMGIQDFEPNVLKLINRKPSLLNINELVDCIKSKSINVNLDFVFGLPGQTPESFERTIARAITLNPERMVTFSYAHVPWVKQAQKLLEQYTIPDAMLKLKMFENAANTLRRSGYVAIGLDHFAKPGDELTKALANKQLHRNFMGYCSRENTGQVYAFGASAISQLNDCYAQNSKDTMKYIDAIAQHGTAIEKGYRMTLLDNLGQKVIESIMCNQFVDFDSVAETFQLTTSELFDQLKFDSLSIVPFESDGLVTFDEHTLQILPFGRMFMRNLAMLFDPLKSEYKTTVYSKII